MGTASTLFEDNEFGGHYKTNERDLSNTSWIAEGIKSKQSIVDLPGLFYIIGKRSKKHYMIKQIKHVIYHIRKICVCFKCSPLLHTIFPHNIHS